MEKIDYLILGGGTAGCALAARLSEDRDKFVVLVEAGRDLREGSVPDIISSRYVGRAYLDKGNVWPALMATFSGAAGRSPATAERFYEQARVLGGGSVINAMVANRGSPDDYDEWGRLGAEGWSGAVALKYFRKLERDVDFGGEFHGKTGPIPIRRLARGRVSPFVDAVCRTLERRGHPRHADQNGAWVDGVFPAAIACSDQGERVPVSLAYLTPEVRGRSNLEIVTGCHVRKLLIEGKHVCGAEVSRTGDAVSGSSAPEQMRAEATIVCMGGIHSAALLLRSGVGPAQELTALHIEVKHHLQGVGKNLMEHPLTAVSTFLPRRSRLRDLREHHDQALLRYTSKSVPDSPAGDMHVAIIARTAWHAIGQRMGTLLVWVNKSYSRGSVTLRSGDPHAEPIVDFKLLSDPRDLARLKEGFRVAAETLLDPGLDGDRGAVFPTSYSERVRKVSAPGWWNAFQMAALSKLLDWAGPLHGAVIHKVVSLGLRVDTLLRDDTKLTDFIANGVAGVWHASGTCRMGAADDAMAVTDGTGRVHGMTGLRVCDSSIMPSIPRANTNTPTLMLAERTADVIREEAAAARRMVDHASS